MLHFMKFLDANRIEKVGSKWFILKETTQLKEGDNPIGSQIKGDSKVYLLPRAIATAM